MKALLAGSLMLSLGCSPTATLTRYERPKASGVIVKSDDESIYLRSAGGKLIPIQRDEVTDIDHPGNVLALVGAAVLAVGAAGFAAELPSCGRLGEAYCTSLIAPPALGVMMTIAGLQMWYSSQNRAKTVRQRYILEMPDEK